MSKHAVMIAGGGPTGLMLAAELALAGVDVAIVESRAAQELIGPRRRSALTHHLRRAVREFIVHYHAERNHQGLGNRIIRAEQASAGSDALVQPQIPSAAC
jgi:2-polyprenyl-6-methoxyphenol hydroxylase-like FAD-dependent oxidoreductase